jgi:hypothetical protein
MAIDVATLTEFANATFTVAGLATDFVLATVTKVVQSVLIVPIGIGVGFGIIKYGKKLLRW